IQRITGTAIELPSALYLCPSGQSLAGWLRQGICVQPLGNPCNLSHSIGVSRRTAVCVATACISLELLAASVEALSFPHVKVCCLVAQVIATACACGLLSAMYVVCFMPGLASRAPVI